MLVENFAPGMLDGWGLGYADLSRENPRLVFCSITGYGSDGPEAGRPGYDFAVQARAGWMAVTGDPDGAPTKAGVAIVDVLTGQNAAIAILAALRERDASGQGQRVEVALFDSAVAGLINVTQAALVTGAEPRRWGNAHPTIVPYQAFDGADRAFVVAVGNDAQWRKLCAAIGADDLGADERFATNPGRIEHRDELVGALAERFRARPAAAWLGMMEAAGVPCAPVQSVGEALADTVLTERDGHLADGRRIIRHRADRCVTPAPVAHARIPARSRARAGRAHGRHPGARLGRVPERLIASGGPAIGRGGLGQGHDPLARGLAVYQGPAHSSGHNPAPRSAFSSRRLQIPASRHERFPCARSAWT